jgi:hypothetical protein
MASKLVLQRQRHLKWRAFDALETVLMILCGVCLLGFSTTVVFDIVTRTIGSPWLWLQEVTSSTCSGPLSGLVSSAYWRIQLAHPNAAAASGAPSSAACAVIPSTYAIFRNVPRNTTRSKPSCRVGVTMPDHNCRKRRRCLNDCSGV